MTERTDTVVIGAGQAGLAASYYLTKQGRDHVVLEKSRVGEAWRSGRWDSFTLVTPNWTLQLPGFPYRGDAPDAFLPRDEVVAYLERYAESFDSPIRLGVEALSVAQRPDNGRYVYTVETTSGPIEAENVIVAAGRFQTPKIPRVGRELPGHILQIHSGAYRNPEALPPGAVLVVGTGQSGAQIAQELYQAGRQVYLSVGSAGRAPRRYRGKDITWWIDATGLWKQTVDQLPSPKAKFAGSPHVSGKAGGRTLNLHQFARDGVVLLGRLVGASEGQAAFAPDLKENLAKADKFAEDLKRAIDKYILQAGLDAPEKPSDAGEPLDGYDAEIVTELDLTAAGISTVIWATGYGYDFGWVRLPVFDADGFPAQKRGVTAYPGLYFLGLPWLHTAGSGVISGVGDDAAHVTADIAARS